MERKNQRPSQPLQRCDSSVTFGNSVSSAATFLSLCRVRMSTPAAFSRATHSPRFCFAAGDAADFVVVGQEDVEIRQDFGEDAIPAIVGIVVGIERKGEAAAFEFA